MPHSYQPAQNAKRKEVAGLFLTHIVKLWGLPRDIVSNRDPRFTRRFWSTFFTLLGTKLSFSTTFHPQTDGQIERVNGMLEDYLKHYVITRQDNWVELLDAVQFAHTIQ
ncbi:unnamed protein product [Spirodela intermedia]|uniref:Integrase catalytic domain-containing protein n=1 Tax=Spirodela intermedia TaxID=51605 RepID=A0A7I8IXW3_SPIIN|nr:unnamed protein product [Spirodela intermedia]CAA6662804.1 unnamed protein product [Spirodela intermedia]